MKVLRHVLTDPSGSGETDISYEVIEATREEEEELLSQPVGTGRDWVEAHAEIIDAVIEVDE